MITLLMQEFLVALTKKSEHTGLQTVIISPLYNFLFGLISNFIINEMQVDGSQFIHHRWTSITIQLIHSEYSIGLVVGLPDSFTSSTSSKSTALVMSTTSWTIRHLMQGMMTTTFVLPL